MSLSLPSDKCGTWSYLGFGTFAGEYNMSLDRQLLAELQSGQRSQPVVRFYCWDRPTVSLGVNQIAEEVVRLDQLSRLGYGLVQRPTGGRALLHKGDICYSIIASKNHHPLFHSLSSSYRAIGQAIGQTLTNLGIKLAEIPATGAGRKSPLGPCFAMLNPFEVTVRGKKICGNAQYRSGDFFLQQGSLRVLDNWTGSDLRDLWPDGQALDKHGITSVYAELHRGPIMTEIVRCWCEAIEDLFGVELAIAPISAVEH